MISVSVPDVPKVQTYPVDRTSGPLKSQPAPVIGPGADGDPTRLSIGKKCQGRA